MSSHREHLKGLSEDVLSLVDCILVAGEDNYECHHQIVFSYSPVLAGCSSLTDTSSSLKRPRKESPFLYNIPIEEPPYSGGVSCMLRYMYSPMSGSPLSLPRA